MNNQNEITTDQQKKKKPEKKLEEDIRQEILKLNKLIKLNKRNRKNNDSVEQMLAILTSSLSGSLSPEESVSYKKLFQEINGHSGTNQNVTSQSSSPSRTEVNRRKDMLSDVNTVTSEKNKKIKGKLQQRRLESTLTTNASPSSESIPQSPPFSKQEDFTYRAITANCGNGRIGDAASKQICEKLKKEKADFYVINCQEAQFYDQEKDPINNELTAQLKNLGYAVERLSKMNTRTKTDAITGTGMACYVVYKNTLSIESPELIKARRGGFLARFRVLSGYNKGGLITDFVITNKSTGKSIKIESVSAHLDRSTTEKRMQDWFAVNHALSSESVHSWDELLEVTPDLRVAGYDANTRDIQGARPWNQPLNYPETSVLVQSSICNHYFTGQNNTYDKEDKNKGQLDFVGISDSSPLTGIKDDINGKPKTENVIQIGTKAGETRDHHVVMSPLSTIKPTNDFEKVRNQIAKRLARCAPPLAEEISRLPDSPQNQRVLIDIYNVFLSKSGRLNNKISQCINDKTQGKDGETPWFNTDTLSNLSQYTLTDRLITQIGNYGVSFDKLKLLDDKAKQALLKRKDNSVYSEKNPMQHRTAFIQYLMKRNDGNDVAVLGAEERNTKMKEAGGAVNAAIDMEKLLDKVGVALYKKALKEERDSPEYLSAVFEKSTNHYDGPTLRKPIAIPVGGPSGCGKSYSAKAIVNKVMEDFGETENTSGNDVVSIDGGVAREVSQIRKLVIQMANKKGYTYVSDLAENSKALDSVKTSVADAAYLGKNGKPLSVVIPETFSKIGLLKKTRKKFFKDLKRVYGDQVYFSRIKGLDGDEEPNRQAVKKKGIDRSAKTDFEKKPIGNFDLNASQLCESKAYSEGPWGISFDLGVRGSRLMEKVHKKIFPKGTIYNVEYGLILIGRNSGSGQWQAIGSDDAYDQYAETRDISKLIFNDWLKAIQQPDSAALTLEQFEEAARNQAKYKITVESTQVAHTGHVKESEKAEIVTAAQVKSIIDRAKEQIVTPDGGVADTLCFDPQGRVLIEVPECCVEVRASNLEDKDKADVVALKKIVFIKKGQTIAIGYCSNTGNYAERALSDNDETETWIKTLSDGQITDNSSLSRIKAYLTALDINAEGLDRNITVSYDITGESAAKKDFEGKIRKRLDSKTQGAIIYAYNQLSTRSSIIPLQQEFYFHLSLALRVYETELGLMSSDEFSKIHKQTMIEVNQLVMDAFAKGLEDSFEPGVGGTLNAINISKLNKALDNARKSILPKAHEILCKEVRAQYGDLEPLSKEKLKEYKHTAEITVATPNSMLHLDNHMGLAMFISGTDVSSHDRGFGVDHLADMQTVAYQYDPRARDENEKIKDPKNNRTQVRVPSIAVKDINELAKPKVEVNCPPWITMGIIKQENIISSPTTDLNALVKETGASRGSFIKDLMGTGFYYKNTTGNYSKLDATQVTDLLKTVMSCDVQDKISEISSMYFAPNFVAPSSQGESTRPNAFVYNLYTTLNSSIRESYFDGKNFQNESLELILDGARRFNRAQLEAGDSAPLCFVQAIGVNGFGDELGYSGYGGDFLHDEATIMAEMALMHTLYDSITDARTKADINTLFDKYKEFVTSNSRVFASNESIGLMINIKKKLKNHKVGQGASVTPQDCLIKMLAHDQHFTNEARLIQALSVVCEENSMSGCKSANERTQVVNSRVALFDSANKNIKNSLDNALTAFFDSDPKQINTSFKTLQKVVDKQCNDENLYGEYSLISCQSQGSSYKAETGEFYDWNTNKIEASSSVMTSHHQEHAAQMQAHKGLVKAMAKAIEATSIIEKPSKNTMMDSVKALFVTDSRWKIKAGGAVLLAIGIVLTIGISLALPFFPLILLGGLTGAYVIAGLTGGTGLAILGREKLLSDKETVKNKTAEQTIEYFHNSSSNVIASRLGGGVPPAPVNNPLSRDSVNKVTTSSHSSKEEKEEEEEGTDDERRSSSKTAGL